MCFFPRGGRRGVRGAERGPCRRPPQPGYGAAPPAGSGRVGPRPAPPASSSRLRTQGGGLRARAAWSRVPGRRRGSAALSARSTPAAPGRARLASPARGSRSPHPPPHTHTQTPPPRSTALLGQPGVSRLTGLPSPGRPCGLTLGGATGRGAERAEGEARGRGGSAGRGEAPPCREPRGRAGRESAGPEAGRRRRRPCGEAPAAASPPRAVRPPPHGEGRREGRKEGLPAAPGAAPRPAAAGGDEGGTRESLFRADKGGLRPSIHFALKLCHGKRARAAAVRETMAERAYLS